MTSWPYSVAAQVSRSLPTLPSLVRVAVLAPLRRRSKIVRCRKNRCPSTSFSALRRILFTPAARQARPGARPTWLRVETDRSRLSHQPTDRLADGRTSRQSVCKWEGWRMRRTYSIDRGHIECIAAIQERSWAKTVLLFKQWSDEHHDSALCDS